MPVRKTIRRKPVRSPITPKAVAAYRTCLETADAHRKCGERHHGTGEGGIGRCLPGCRENRDAGQTLRLELGVRPWQDDDLLFHEKTYPDRDENGRDFWTAQGDWPERAAELRTALQAYVNEPTMGKTK